MEQQNYKTLFLKLSVATFGLVGMLSLGIMLAQNILSLTPAINADYTQGNLALKRALNEEFNIIVESDPQTQRTRALLDETFQTEKVKKLFLVRMDMIEKIGKVIRAVARQEAIPTGIKNIIIADLERQLADNERNLYDLQRQLLNLSAEMIWPQSRYKSSRKCSKEIITESCDGVCSDDDSERNAERDVREKSKASLENFSWI